MNQVKPAEQGHDRDQTTLCRSGQHLSSTISVLPMQKAQIIPSMARKWKQINKFVEIFSGALSTDSSHRLKALRVVDFGSGKGYLTFALYDYMQKHGQTPFVTGVELNPKMVEFLPGCCAAIWF